MIDPEVQKVIDSLEGRLNTALAKIRDLEDSMDYHVGIDYGANQQNAPHPNMSVNTIESGGGLNRLDKYGIQGNTNGGTNSAIYFVDGLKVDPSNVSGVQLGLIIGEVSSGNYATTYLEALAADGLNSPYVSVTAYETGEAYVSISGAPLLYGTALGGILSPAQITSNQNDYNPTGLKTTGILRLTSDASRDITGISGGVTGLIRLIFNVGSFNIVLKDESASSTAANRFALNGDVTLQPDNSVGLWYDSTSSRWRVF